jgi:S-DNA-T family DNA segregation ATPase FtsK/SpoIIIE
LYFNKLARKIEEHYSSFGLALKLALLEVVDSSRRLIYDVSVKKGTKVNLIFERAKDVQIALKLRFFQVFYEGVSIRLAVSDRSIIDNSLKRMLISPQIRSGKYQLPIALGYDMRGKMFFADLVEFVHAMYGGATNSGKTVGLRSMILSLVDLHPVSAVNLIIIDTYTSKLHIFNPLPHLVMPVVTEMDQAVSILQALADEMERRLTLPHDELRLLPALVCLIDEYINLVKNLEDPWKNKLIHTLSSLLRLGRQAKMHVILATQEPNKSSMQISLNNVNGRMAFTCSNYYNSIAILGSKGAEQLPGNGALYFKAPGQDPIPLQGSAMETADIEQMVARIASHHHDCSKKFAIPDEQLLSSPVSEIATLNAPPIKANAEITELAKIILWALGCNTISANLIEAQFRMGRRAQGILEKLFQMGIVSEKYCNQPRNVVLNSVDEIPPEVVTLLLNSGITVDDIAAAIQSRN